MIARGNRIWDYLSELGELTTSMLERSSSKSPTTNPELIATGVAIAPNLGNGTELVFH